MARHSIPLLLTVLSALTTPPGIAAQPPAEQDLLYIAEYEIAPGRVIGDALEEASTWVRGLRETGAFESVRLFMHDMGPALSVYMVMEPRSWESLRTGFEDFFAAQPDLFTTPWRWAGHSDNILAEIPVNGEGETGASGGAEDDGATDATVQRLRYQGEAMAVAGLASALGRGQSAEEHGEFVGRVFARSWGASLTPEGFAQGMLRNFESMGASAEVVSSSPNRVVLEATRPWAETFERRYEGWGPSAEQYEASFGGILRGIGAAFGISVETERAGELLRITFTD